jgi:hypothetical protein
VGDVEWPDVVPVNPALQLPLFLPNPEVVAGWWDDSGLWDAGVVCATEVRL